MNTKFANRQSFRSARLSCVSASLRDILAAFGSRRDAETQRFRVSLFGKREPRQGFGSWVPAFAGMTRRFPSPGLAAFPQSDTLPFFYARDHERDNLVLEPHRVEIADARQVDPAPGLDREGFTLVPHTSAVADFTDTANVD